MSGSAGGNYIKGGQVNSTNNHHHLLLFFRPPCPSSLAQPSPPQSSSLATTPLREWLTNSSVHPRTAPSSSNQKSSTAYPTGNLLTSLPLSDPTQSHPPNMSLDSSTLSHLARSKLSLSTSSKNSCNLHRWVLLKNSILSSPSNSSLHPAQSQLGNSHDDPEDDDDVHDEVLGDTDTFMFPDAGQLIPNSTSDDVKGAEAQWLDSLLEGLADDEDDDYYYHSDSDVQHSPLPVDDEEFPLYSPVGSPMSSSPDLPTQPSYYPSPISVSYPVPYPSSLIHAYAFDSQFDSLVSSVSAPYEDPLPYHDIDDIEDLSVPDAIEDTSDDESDAPTTPSIGMSRSSLSLVDAASIPLPPERSRLRHSSPRVYVGSDDSYFYPFEIDPLPFPEEHVHTSYNHFQEC